MAAGAKRLPAAALAAFGLGIVACPLPFIIRGALGQFSPVYAAILPRRPRALIAAVAEMGRGPDG